jgi:hypothetical protein
MLHGAFVSDGNLSWLFRCLSTFTLFREDMLAFNGKNTAPCHTWKGKLVALECKSSSMQHAGNNVEIRSKTLDIYTTHNFYIILHQIDYMKIKEQSTNFFFFF